MTEVRAERPPRLVRVRADDLSLEQREFLLKKDHEHYDSDETMEGLMRRVEASTGWFLFLVPTRRGGVEREEVCGYLDLDDRTGSWATDRGHYYIRWFVAWGRRGCEMLRMLEDRLGAGVLLCATVALDPNESPARTLRRLNFWLHRGFCATGISYESGSIVRLLIEKTTA